MNSREIENRILKIQTDIIELSYELSDCGKTAWLDGIIIRELSVELESGETLVNFKIGAIKEVE